MPVMGAGKRFAARPSGRLRRLIGRIGRRALLVTVVALVVGPLAYILLPIPSGAAPGGPTPVPLAAPVVVQVVQPSVTAVAALVGGIVETDDLTANPIGVVTGTTLADVDGLIGWPVTDHTPSTGFGYRSDPFTHRQRWHDGVDLGQPCGDPARASLDGTVTYTGWAGGYGNRIILKHADRSGHTFETAYSHLSQIDVTVGQAVKQAETIGRIGSTGRSTACHMHFEVILDGAYVDPMRFLTGDQTKAALSRRVGSRMPQGMPSPSGTDTSSPYASTRTPKPSSATPSTTTSTPAPISPVAAGASDTSAAGTDSSAPASNTPSSTGTETPAVTPSPTPTPTPTPSPESPSPETPSGDVPNEDSPVASSAEEGTSAQQSGATDSAG